jgi:hypothetical protein
VVLFMSSVSEGSPEFIKKIRKRPTSTATNARTIRAIFGDQVLKELEIPEFIELYNHFMNGVDQADRLQVYYDTQRAHSNTLTFGQMEDFILCNIYLAPRTTDDSESVLSSPSQQLQNQLHESNFT